jgi:hypothetical protein
VLELASGVKLDPAPVKGKPSRLQEKASALYAHLIGNGKTICRQYFRLQWVPRLGPAAAWLILALRSRCYYRPDDDELRDIYTWPKKDLAAILGQSEKNLIRLMAHPYLPSFTQILEAKRHTLTIRVAMAVEPLTSVTAEEFWERQPPIKEVTSLSATGQNVTSLVSNRTKCDKPPPQNRTKCDKPPLRIGQNVTSLDANRTKCDTYKYYIESVLHVVEEDTEEVLKPADQTTVEEILITAGLSGAGLQVLCRREPPLEPSLVRAVQLYAEAHNLGPGYIYRCLEDNSPVDELFLRFAALGETTLALFRQAISELKINGGLISDIQTPIPPEEITMFAQFAEVFAGVEAAAVLVALHRPAAVPDPEIDPSDLDVGPPAAGQAEAGELDILWGQALEQLQQQMTRQTFAAWVRDTRLVARAGLCFTIAAKNSFAVEWLQHRLSPTIQRTLASLIRESNGEMPAVEVLFVLGSSLGIPHSAGP